MKFFINNDRFLNSIQSLRAIAFLSIFLAHSNITFFCHAGVWGVSVFIIMSGFLMVYNYYPKMTEINNPFRFSIRKIKRLYPLHILMLIVGLIVNINNIKFNSVVLLPHVFLLQILIPNEDYFASINGVSWYLSLSLFLYMIFPYIIKIIKKINNRKKIHFLIFGLLICEMCYVYFILNYIPYDNKWFSHKWFIYYCPINRIVDYTIGACFGYLFIIQDKKPTSKKNIILFSFIELVCLGATVFIWMAENRVNKLYGYYWTLLPLLTSVPLVVLFAKMSGQFSRLLTNRIVVYIGNISPYTFLIHPIVIKLTSMIGFNHKTTSVIISLIVTIVLSELYNKFDKKFLAQKVFLQKKT